MENDMAKLEVWANMPVKDSFQENFTIMLRIFL